MKKLFAMIITTLVLSGCVVNVTNQQPIQQLTTQYCRWVDIPVYGYADVYRSQGTTIRIQQVASVSRQWRCN